MLLNILQKIVEPIHIACLKMISDNFDFDTEKFSSIAKRFSNVSVCIYTIISKKITNNNKDVSKHFGSLVVQ